MAYKDLMPLSSRLGRILWNLVWFLLFLPSPRYLFFWRCFLLRLFGAKIGSGAHIYPSAKIWAPWNLEMGDRSSLGVGVNCYCMDKISIGENATISQGAHLCAGTHDIRDPQFQLMTKPIVVGRNAWVAAEAFIGPGVTVGEGAVIGARAVVFRDVAAWVVAAGNPAKRIGNRKLRDSSSKNRVFWKSGGRK